MDSVSDYLEEIVQCAVMSALGEEPRLNLIKINEMTVAGRIAYWLQTCGKFGPGVHVDQEYNLLGDETKFLDANEDLRKSAKKVRRRVYEDETIVVRPDIVIHGRGANSKNLAIIEVKFADASEAEMVYAQKKLEAYKNQLEYCHAFIIKIGRTGGVPSFTIAEAPFFK